MTESSGAHRTRAHATLAPAVDIHLSQSDSPESRSAARPWSTLPIWTLTRKTARRLLWFFSLSGVLAIALLAARPLLEPRLIQGADSLPHYYTLVQLDYLVRQGILFTRWFPHKYSGFGAPFFLYYAPLAFYVAQGWVQLGLELLAAFRLAWGLTLVGASLGMYLWARDALNRGPALVATAAYVWGPYLLFNAFFRAGYTEQFALMLMPFALWAFRRLAVSARARYLSLAALTYAGLHLVHTLSALIFTPVLLAYTLALAIGEREESARSGVRWAVLLRLWVAIGFGVGLAAFFWLPAFWERSALMTSLASANPAVEVGTNFVSLRRLVLSPLASETGPALSLVVLCLVAVGLVAAGHRETGRASRWEVWLAALAAGASSVLALPLSAPIWETLPLLSLFQFPFRFLSVAALLAAFLAGFGVQALRNLILSRPSMVASSSYAALLLLALGLLFAQTGVLSRVNYYPPLPEIDVGFIMQKERESAPFLGQFTGAYIPSTVQEPPPLAQQVMDGPQRLDLDSLPAGAGVLSADYGALRYDLVLSSPEPFSALFRTFFFPGWVAEIDGQPAPIAVADPHGQISVDVPAGEHHLAVWFGPTPIRTTAIVVSLVTALALGWYTVRASVVGRRTKKEVREA